MSPTVRTPSFASVRLLVVVLLLAVLAALALHQSSESSEDAASDALQADVSMIRKQIMSYILQHGGRTPAEKDDGSIQVSAFTTRLLERTDSDGKLNAKGKCGPYLLRFPVNPLNDKATVRIDGPVAGQGTHGWHYDTTTGIFAADHSAAHASF